jgi:hypothetical protein
MNLAEQRELLLQITADFFEITIEDMKGPCREPIYVDARMIYTAIADNHGMFYHEFIMKGINRDRTSYYDYIRRHRSRGPRVFFLQMVIKDITKKFEECISQSTSGKSTCYSSSRPQYSSSQSYSYL